MPRDTPETVWYTPADGITPDDITAAVAQCEADGTPLHRAVPIAAAMAATRKAATDGNE